MDEARLNRYYNYFQHGGELNVFHGGRDQYGYGLGSFLGRLARGVWDFVRPAASSAATSFIANAAQGINEGKDLKESAKSAFKTSVGTAIRGLGEEADRRIQRGSGRRRRRTKRVGMPRRRKHAKRAPAKRAPAKRRRVYKRRPKRRSAKRRKFFTNF